MFRLGCLIFSIIPTVLMITTLLVVAVTLGMLPPPATLAVSSAERMIGQGAYAQALAESGITLRSISVADITTKNGDKVATALTINVQSPQKPGSVDQLMRTALARAATGIDVPFGMARGVERITINLFVTAITKKPSMTISVTRDELIEWQAGRMDDAALAKIWEK